MHSLVHEVKFLLIIKNGLRDSIWISDEEFVKDGLIDAIQRDCRGRSIRINLWSIYTETVDVFCLFLAGRDKSKLEEVCCLPTSLGKQSKPEKVC